MRTHESNVNHAMLINHHDHQPVTITLDIEDDPVIGDKASITVYGLDMCRALPVSAFHIMEPGLQGNGSIGMFLPLPYASKTPT
jgi:hypothetical protein